MVVLIVIAVGAWMVTDSNQLPAGSAEVRRLASLGVDVIELDASAIVRRGSPRALALRFDGQVEFVPYHFSDQGLDAPQPVDVWAEQLEAAIVFNAGQFDENLAHLGWLKQEGKWIVPHRHGSWQALLLSGPTDGAAWARIADLDLASAEVTDRYRNVIQSMMLVDHERRIRVRDTDKSACRTVVAEDSRGRIILVVTEGAVALGDLARWLAEQDLDVVRAMNLDGGIEAQLAISTPELDLTFFGQYGTGTTSFDGAPGKIRYPIPAVIAVRHSGRPTRTTSTR